MYSSRRIGWAQWTLGLPVAILLAAGPWACGGGDHGSMGGNSLAVQRTNLVADVAGQALVTDPNLVNPWGIARSPTGPFWVSDNGAGVSTLYNGSGQAFPVGQPLIVTVPPPAGSQAGAKSAPTGIVFNGTNDFAITDGAKSVPSLFIFATEDGTISGWNQAVNAGTPIVTVDNSAGEAIYKGLALATNGSVNFLYATNFRAGRVDVFADPDLPAGFAPFGITEINGQLFVTYANQDDGQEDDVAGPGNGFVDVFDTNGVLMQRFASRGTLNSPWGVVLAPAGFGSLGNDLLVGNFGDGRINVFASASGTFLGQLSDGDKPIAIDGLWGLAFGNGGTAGDVNTLFFTAGPDGESHGIFGMLQPM
jgi:uncharacterized protein (TIGR03118 family)